MIEACSSGKIRFDDEAAAHAQMRLMRRSMRRRERGVMPTGVYLCSRCDGWHLTSKPQRRFWRRPR